MPKKKITPKHLPEAHPTLSEKNEILKKVAKKTTQYYEEAIREKEKEETEAVLEEEMKRIKNLKT